MIYNCGVCSEPCSSFIRHCRLSALNLWKMFVFSALLPKELATFAFVVLGLNYDLHIVFYVVFCNFRKN